MELKIGHFYFIDDSFFDLVKDPFLKKDHMKTKRPHYCAMKDEKTSLYWMVPISSKVEKYRAVIQRRKAQHKKTASIKLAKVKGQERAFTFADMFPIDKKYIVQEYRSLGNPVRIFPKDEKYLNHNAHEVVGMLRAGVKFIDTQPNVKRIEQIMVAKKRIHDKKRCR